MLRLLAPIVVLPLLACSSSPSSGGSAADASVVDGSLGPFLCGFPVASTCPTTAPCTFAAWGCAQPVCDDYQVITDGAWIYYYSLPGGQLAGEVATDDAGVEACPYGFVAPTSCTPVVASQCSADAGGGD